MKWDIMSIETSPVIDAGGLIQRMREVSGAARDEDLASVLGLTVSAISKWRQRNSVPLEAVLTIADRCSVSIDYLIRGDVTTVGRVLQAVRGRGVSERLLRPLRPQLLIKGDLLSVAMERSAQEWAADNPERELEVFDLGHRTARLYGDYLLAVASDQDHEGAVVDAMATVLRPHIRWRRLGAEGWRLQAKVGTEGQGRN